MTGRPPLPCSAYLVAGLGRAGTAALAALSRHPAAERVVAWDEASTPLTRAGARTARRTGVEVVLGGDGLDALSKAGPNVTIIKSPGIYPDIPLLRAARVNGVQVLDELELGWRLSDAPMVAVTGTNGKSTTCALVLEVLHAAGERASSAGNTEFGPPLSGIAADGWVVCEASSFQLEASPSFQPDVAVFTNLTLEHLARHRTMERYGAAKRGMFIGSERTAGTSIINIDDPFGRGLAGEVGTAGGAVVTYGFAADADMRVEAASWDIRTAALRLCTPRGVVELETQLPGEHNARNVAAALAVGHALGFPARASADALSHVKAPPGRWEVIDNDRPFDVVVDYAHTPDGIYQALSAVRSILAARGTGALITVFGAVGVRDPDKARESGRLVRALSDHLILTTGTTAGDPRIPRLQELIAAAGEGGTLEIILDREAAIWRAVAVASAGDVVLALGLGALGRLILDRTGAVRQLDDREVARAALRALPV
ncbi:MAG: Mur ligase family protein [Solirubrobacteraceae bacterium]|jgi:UDP-N-acetylmuramoyl-L-alanyl-D-glutamate--2,6-diaminopimelate ligase